MPLWDMFLKGKSVSVPETTVAELMGSWTSASTLVAFRDSQSPTATRHLRRAHIGLWEFRACPQLAGAEATQAEWDQGSSSCPLLTCTALQSSCSNPVPLKDTMEVTSAHRTPSWEGWASLLTGQLCNMLAASLTGGRTGELHLMGALQLQNGFFMQVNKHNITHTKKGIPSHNAQGWIFLNLPGRKWCLPCPGNCCMPELG